MKEKHSEIKSLKFEDYDLWEDGKLTIDGLILYTYNQCNQSEYGLFLQSFKDIFEERGLK